MRIAAYESLRKPPDFDLNNCHIYGLQPGLFNKKCYRDQGDVYNTRCNDSYYKRE